MDGRIFGGADFRCTGGRTDERIGGNANHFIVGNRRARNDVDQANIGRGIAGMQSDVYGACRAHDVENPAADMGDKPSQFRHIGTHLFKI